jgi:hypothetical protein
MKEQTMVKMKKIFIIFTAGVVLAAAAWAEPDVYVAGCAKNTGLVTGKTASRPRPQTVVPPPCQGAAASPWADASANHRRRKADRRLFGWQR